MENDWFSRLTWNIRHRRQYFKYKKYLNKKHILSMSSPKIILVSHESSETGAVVLLMEMIRELYLRDYEVLLLTRDYGPLVEKASQYACVKVFLSRWEFKRFIQYALENDYTKAICNTVVTGYITDILKLKNIKIISLVHELPTIIKRLNVGKSALSAAENSDIVVFPSKYVLDKFPFKNDIKGKVIIKPQGVNYVTDFPKDRYKAKKTLFDLFSIPITSKVILGVGSGDKRKGFDLFLELASKSLDDSTSFVWVGSYSIEIYCEFMNKNKINTIHNLYLTGFIENKDVLNTFYAAAEVFSLTSREDPFPSVVLQAFNSKVPVVAFENAGGFADIVINEETGFLVELENTDEMFDRIIYLLNNEAERIKMGLTAEALMKKYNFTDYVEFLYALFDN